MHYKFLPVDINKSQKDFTLEGSKIRIGFKAVKGLGDSAIDELISEVRLEALELEKDYTDSKIAEMQNISDGYKQAISDIKAL